MKALVIDIETAPHTVYTWTLWNANIGINQIIKTGGIISFAAKWHGDKSVAFHSDFHDGHDEMILRAHEMLNEADALVHFNGKKFDVPHLEREFIQAGLKPPAPFAQVDLYQVARKRGKWASNKLQHLATELGIGGKVEHTGFDLWARCLAGDERAWSLLKRYNKQDVVLTDALYDRLLPWIPSHPHVALYDDIEGDSCQNCGSTDLRKEGFAYTPLGKFQQYQCKKCGRWSRGKRAIASVDLRGVAK